MNFKAGFILFILLGYGFLSCKQKAQPEYSSSEIFELSPPQITIDSILFKDSATLKVDFEFEGTKIHYTTDGSDVNEASLIYDKPFSVTESGTYSFKSFHPAYKLSKQVSASLIKTKYITPDIETTISPAPHPNYLGNGNESLLDLKKGSLQFRNGTKWLGFQTPIITINLDFKKPVLVSKVIFSTLRDHNSWIFSPKHIIAKNREQKVGSSSIDKPAEQQKAELIFIEIPIKKDTYTNLELQIHLLKEIPSWHQGKGTLPFFFLDEIILE